MNQNWKYKQYPGFEFPEQYFLKLTEDHFIEVKANSLKGLVKIRIKNPQGNYYESKISNGVVIDERDLQTNKSRYLEDFFRLYSKELSSLPDQTILRAMGNNYSILSEFLDDDNLDDDNKEKTSVPTKLKEHITDLSILLRLPNKILSILLDYLKAIFQKPTLQDITDITLISMIGLSVFFHNFDYTITGIYTAAAALCTGYYDWLIRKKHPYAFKIIAFFVLSFYSVFIGMCYQ